jgi:hypothetical protein
MHGVQPLLTLEVVLEKKWKSGFFSSCNIDSLFSWLVTAVVWTSLGPLPRWVPGPTTRWASGITQLALHGT